MPDELNPGLVKEISEGFEKVKADVIKEVRAVTAEQKAATDEQLKQLRAEEKAERERMHTMFSRTRDSFQKDGMFYAKDKWVSLNDFFKAAAGRRTKTLGVQEFRNLQEWLKAERNYEEKGSGLSEGSTTAGGYLVPTEMDAMILELLTEPDMISSKVQRITTGSDAVYVNKETTAPAGSFISEASSVITGTTDPVFGQQKIEVYKWGYGIAIANELLADALANVGQYLGRRIPTIMAYDMMKYIIAGSGSSQPTGIIQSTPAGYTNYATLAYSNILTAYFALTEPYLRNAVWGLPRTYMATLLALADAGSNLVFQNIWQQKPPFNLFGLPIIANSNWTANTIWLVDCDGYIMVDRGITEFKVFDQTYANTDQTYFRFLRRWGGEQVRTAGIYELIKT